MNEFIKTNDSQIRKCTLKSFDKGIMTEEITGHEKIFIDLSAMKLFLKIFFSLILFCSLILTIEVFISLVKYNR